MQQPFDDNTPPALNEILKAHAHAHASDGDQVVSRDTRVVRAGKNFNNKDPKGKGLENWIQNLLRPRVRFVGKSLSAYNAFGVLGIALLVTIGLSLTIARGQSVPVMLGLLILALFLSVLNIVLTTLITGKDSLVFLRYFLSIMAVAALLLRILEQPVLPYLENLMLGMGALQGVGRIGCLRVGCCYGKPARFGIRYTDLYARAGFPKALVGVKLFPVQLLESGWILLSAGLGVILALVSPTAGYGLSTYIILFASGRFCFELLRGDMARPYFAGFSEAQWISIGLVCGVSIFEITDIWPLHTWHIVVTVCLLLGLVVLRFLDNRPAVLRLKKPAVIHELAKTLSLLEKGRTQHLAGDHAIHLRKVNGDLQISDGIFSDGFTHKIHHYTLSYANRSMPTRDAIIISNMIQSWHPQEEKTKLINFNTNTFHLLSFYSIGS